MKKLLKVALLRQDWALMVDGGRREPLPAKVLIVETADCKVLSQTIHAH